MPKLVVAAFDFDGTLTRYNTFLPLLHAVSPSSVHFAMRFGRLLPYSPYWFAGEEGRGFFKAKLIDAFFQGVTRAHVKKKAERFFNKVNVGLFLPDGLKRLEWHLEQQHLCYVVSANLTPFLEEWVLKYPGLKLLATDLESQNGVYTGRMGNNCWGEEKLRRLQEAVNHEHQEKEWILYAYGDSLGDKALLAEADYAHYRPFR